MGFPIKRNFSFQGKLVLTIKIFKCSISYNTDFIILYDKNVQILNNANFYIDSAHYEKINSPVCKRNIYFTNRIKIWFPEFKTLKIKKIQCKTLPF